MEGTGETDLQIGLITSERDEHRYSLQDLIKRAEDIQSGS